MLIIRRCCWWWWWSSWMAKSSIVRQFDQWSVNELEFTLDWLLVVNQSFDFLLGSCFPWLGPRSCLYPPFSLPNQPALCLSININPRMWILVARTNNIEPGNWRYLSILLLRRLHRHRHRLHGWVVGWTVNHELYVRPMVGWWKAELENN